MRVYMIDRNIVSKISSGFKNCSIEDKNFIKSLDTKGSAISLLLSNIEGRLGIPQDMSQASSGMFAEGDIAKGFFKKARVDSGFFEAFNNLASWVSQLIRETLSEKFRNRRIPTRYVASAAQPGPS